jgi:bacteriocin biosynthesis cyclodehydratase domain-containing protein
MDTTATLTGHRLRFAPHLRAETVPGEGVYLISERTVTRISDQAAIALADLLDGTRDLAGVIADRPAWVPADHAGELLRELLTAGLLWAQPPGGNELASEAYWSLAGLNGSRVGEQHVVAITLGDADPEALTTALRNAGLRLVSGGRSCDADLTVVACSDYLDPELTRINAEQLKARRPWLMGRTTSATAWLGPLLRPGEGACWHCLAVRLQGHRQPEAYVAERLGRKVHPPVTAPPAGEAAILNLLALEAAKWLAGHRHPDQGTIWVLDTLTLQGTHHPVNRRPQCPSCGDRGLVSRRSSVCAIALPGRGKGTLTGERNAVTGLLDGGSTPLDEPPLRRFGHLVSPVTGVIREVCEDRREPEFACSFHAAYVPPPMPSPELPAVRAGLHAVGSGKGATAEEAKAGAVYEALERHSGHYQGDEPALLASFRELGADAIHVNDVQLFHPRQFRERSAWNSRHSPAQAVFEPFDETARISWTPVWSLAGQRRLLPTALLYYNVPEKMARRSCRADSNGTAAGRTLPEAVLHGMYELVERDAVALWWYNRTRQPGIDLRAFNDRWIDEMCVRYRSLNREVWALDLTSDLEIPVIVALSARFDKQAEDVMFGFGANLDPRIALRRAVAELNQVLPSVASARADGSGYGCQDKWAMQWWRTATRAGMPYLTPDPGRTPLSPEVYPDTPVRDPLGTVTAIHTRLTARGMEALVLDQSRPDVGLPVAKVIVPGLRPHWARFGNGRLREVPVRLGRLPAPTPYENLNPMPLPV